VTIATMDGPTSLRGSMFGSRLEPRSSDGSSDGVSLIGAYTVNQLRFAVDIRRESYDFDRRRASTEFAVGFMSSITATLSIGGGPTIGFGEVTPSRSPVRAGGERSVGLNGAATLSLSENWALTGVLGYRSRTDGSKEESFFSVLGLGYRF